MRRSLAAVASSLFVLCLASSASAGTVKRLDLADGYSRQNTIESPIYVSTSLAPVAVGVVRSDYDRKGAIIRRLSHGAFTRGVKADVDPSIDLGALLAEAMRRESATMGFPSPSAAAAAWTVSGSVSDVALESRQVPFGPVVFYAFMTLSIDVAKGRETPQRVAYRLANMYGRYNAGGSRKDEAAEALTTFLVDSAQEVLGSLNRKFFHGAASPALRRSLDALSVKDGGSAVDRRIVGLSGDEESAKVLMNLLEKEDDEGIRSELIDAMANIGSPRVFETLARRYAEEDEDCRFLTLKAMDYLGSDAAVAFVKDRGPKDDDDACRSLAARVGGTDKK